MLYEGLLSNTCSVARRGMEEVVWGESEGVVYRLDGKIRVGMDVFTGINWYEKDDVFGIINN